MIGFVGLSHLGIVTGIATASKGFDVLAFDPDPRLCAELNQGRLPFFEPGLTELLVASTGRIRFTAEPADLTPCDVIYLSRDVPTSSDNQSDLAGLTPLLETIAANAAPETTIVVLCQVPPGFSRPLARRFRADSLNLLYQVETLIFGRAVERALQPERFIIGCDDPQAALPASYAQLLDAFGCPVMPMRYESAELTKIAINMCLVSSVSVANTLAEICEAIGADWPEIVPALKLDRRIGPHSYLAAGLGIAGGNLERDLVTITRLAAEHGTDASVVRAWQANSQYRRDWVLRLLHSEVLPRCPWPTLAVWGLAYKQDTTSTKNSPALALLEALGPWPVQAYDPQVRLTPDSFPTITQFNSPLEACQGADVLAVMTPWREFSAVDMAQVDEVMRGRIVIDPYGAIERRRCVERGMVHYQLGTPFQSQETAA